CLDRPTSGFYRLDGKEVSALSDRELSAIRATRIGFIFQTFNLLPRYSVLDNVRIPFLYRDTPPEEAEMLSRQAVRNVGLEDRANHSPAELSGGELQRAAIARALAVEPALLLADEPTGNLDTRTGEEILALFEKLNDQGKTILMVTHNPDIAAASHRTILLRDGRLVDV
ncbi:MAG: ABC transporter ATP-binding protein, partial [Candidatus Aminicenantes bacterium]|nr:ABC transporter ATP-binding protein [Candidatus Aminicenantes bacterium]